MLSKLLGQIVLYSSANYGICPAIILRVIPIPNTGDELCDLQYFHKDMQIYVRNIPKGTDIGMWRERE